MMEMQDIIRRASDPLADYRRHVDSLTDVRSLVEHDYLGDIVRQAEESRGLLEPLALDDYRLTRIDPVGLTTLAEQAESHHRLLTGPLEDYKRLSVLDTTSPLRHTFDTALVANEDYAKSFRLPAIDEIDRLAREAVASVSTIPQLYGPDPFGGPLQTAMQSMHAPWLQIDDALHSVQSFAELQAIGHAVNKRAPFEATVSAALRDALGDWRDLTVLPPLIYEDAIARSDFYIGRGFNPSLTDFTARAFAESTALAGLGRQFVEKPEEDEEDEEELGLARTNAAHDQLQRFEQKVRRFVDAVMTEAFGPQWIKRQTPAGMLDSWKEKKATALAKGESEQPIIAYADFTDYIKIIERNDNWNAVFQTIFGRRDDVKESFLRLFPIRICTMHSRLITFDDELLLQVETRRILRAIARAS
jgi:hypothetical protein